MNGFLSIVLDVFKAGLISVVSKYISDIFKSLCKEVVNKCEVQASEFADMWRGCQGV